MAQIEIIITGKVQGVWYRKSAREQALRLKLRGTVQNLPDGSVRIHADGHKEKLDELVAWCRTGPPDARVGSVDVRAIAMEGLTGFKVLR